MDWPPFTLCRGAETREILARQAPIYSIKESLTTQGKARTLCCPNSAQRLKADSGIAVQRPCACACARTSVHGNTTVTDTAS